MPNGIDDFLKGAGEALKTCPKLYDDLVHPVAKATGELVATIPEAINAALTPLHIWIDESKIKRQMVSDLLVKKLKDKNPQDIVSPESYVAVPALQAISYSMHNEELRNLYANLLAKSMQKNTKDFVHPSFVEVIKQLSPFEAKLLAELYTDFSINNNELPLMQLSASTHTKDEAIDLMIRFQGTPDVIPDSLTVIPNIICPKYSNSLNLQFVSSALDNLTRLKLIDIFYDKSITNKSLYNEIINSSKISEYIDKIKNEELFQGHIHELFTEGCVNPSSFGKFFVDTCVLE